MARTLNAAVSAIYDAIQLASVVTFDHVPTTDEPGPIISIDLSGANASATEWTIPVRGYVRGSLPTATDAQTLVISTVDEIEALFDQASLGSPYAIVYLSDRDLWQVEWSVNVPREDL